MTATPKRLRTLDRLAQGHHWHSVSLRTVGSAHPGYLFTRGPVQVELRTDASGRIARAIRTAVGQPAADPAVDRFGAAARWLTESPAPWQGPARLTRVHRPPFGQAYLVTSDTCTQCGGAINNGGLARRAEDTDRWVHLHEADWVDNVHQAHPVGGPITDNDQPGPWLIAGRP